MASIIKDPNGRKRIQFVASDKTRKSIRLGKASMRQAEAIKAKIEQLIFTSTGRTNIVDTEVAKWLAGLDDIMYERLVAVGLASERGGTQLGPFLDGYINERTDVKPATTLVYGHTQRNLVEFFGAEKLLNDITVGDAERWRLFLVSEGLAKNTVRRRCGIAKQFFKVAVQRGLILSSPFEGLKAAVKGNPEKFYFISQEEAQKVLGACPDAQWRLIFALSRYGGLRCPSEHLALRWSDIDWERSRMRVPSPKTEHHVGGESRLVPIFPELMPHLREVFEAAEPGSEYVISHYRKPAINLRKNLEQIIEKAGLKTWPKLFQNLRATRQTELCEQWPEHIVCTWIGNSQQVARKHYLQITEKHYEKAAGMVTSEAAQEAALHGTAKPRIEPNSVIEPPLFDEKRGYAIDRERKMGDTGLEPVTSRV